MKALLIATSVIFSSITTLAANTPVQGSFIKSVTGNFTFMEETSSAEGCLKLPVRSRYEKTGFGKECRSFIVIDNDEQPLAAIFCRVEAPLAGPLKVDLLAREKLSAEERAEFGGGMLTLRKGGKVGSTKAVAIMNAQDANSILEENLESVEDVLETTATGFSLKTYATLKDGTQKTTTCNYKKVK